MTDSFHARSLAVSLTVTDLQRSLSWYRDVLGFTVERQYEREGRLQAVSLSAGDVRIMLGQDDGAKGWDRVRGEGCSFLLTTDMNIDEVADRIKSHGGTLDTEPTDTPWGTRAFRLHDPDGFRLAISSAPPVAPAS